MNKVIAIIYILLNFFFSSSQQLEDVILKTEFEQYESADADFKLLMSKTKDEKVMYYYGENYFKQDKYDSAENVYVQGVSLYPEMPLNYIGLGKSALLKNDLTAAETSFDKAILYSKGKRPDVYRELAEAWLMTSHKEPNKAIHYAELAIKLEKKNHLNYILLGDAQLEKDPSRGGEPIKNYQKATSLNPKSVRGILKEGRLYQRGRNYQLAFEKYNMALAIDSTFAPAYRERAELYYIAGKPSKSIESWQKYLVLNNSRQARYRFICALYENKQYSEVTHQYEQLKNQSFKNLYLERIASYSYYEEGAQKDKDAYAKGLIAIINFFDMAGSDFKYLPDDYKYKGLLLLQNSNDSLAMLTLNMAIEMDSTLISEIASEVSKKCMRDKNYLCVIEQLERKKAKTDLTNADLYDLGKSYYFLATDSLNESNNSKNIKDERCKKESATKLFKSADTTFLQLCIRVPTWPITFAYRARVNTYMDPEVATDTTKSIYETLIKILQDEANNQYKAYLIEAYEYLGYYYVKKKDKVNADKIWTKVKELDPENQKQLTYFKARK